MDKSKLNSLLEEANILLDEIEITIDNMFADAIEAQILRDKLWQN